MPGTLEQLKERIDAARSECARMRGRLERLEEEKARREARSAELEREAETLEKVCDVFRAASESARERARRKVEAAVTDALQAVFGPGIRFKASVGNRGGRPYADFTIESEYGGARTETPILEARGGGVVDVASLALRTLAAVITSPGKVPIVLDEPGKHLSEGYSAAFGELLKSISRETGRQFIVVTHDPRLAEMADRVYRVEQVNGVSRATLVGEERGTIS